MPPNLEKYMLKQNPKKIKEKNSIKLTANCMGGAFLLGTGLSLFVQIVLIIVLDVFGKAELIYDEGVLWIMQMAISTLLFTLPFILLSYACKTTPSKCCAFGKPKKGTTLPLVMFGFGVCMLANLLGSLFTQIFDAIGINVEQSSLATDPFKSWFFPLMSILCGAILPALIEEFALRGIVLGAFKRFGNVFAIIVSAAFFAIMHGNLTQIPFTFIFGLYMGFVTVKSESMWGAIILHFFNNAMAFSIEIVMSIWDLPLVLVNSLYMFIMFILGFVGIMLAKDKHLFTLPDDTPTNLSQKEKLSATFFSPCVIIYIVYILFNIVLLTFFGG